MSCTETQACWEAPTSYICPLREAILVRSCIFVSYFCVTTVRQQGETLNKHALQRLDVSCSAFWVQHHSDRSTIRQHLTDKPVRLFTFLLHNACPLRGFSGKNTPNGRLFKLRMLQQSLNISCSLIQEADVFEGSQMSIFRGKNKSTSHFVILSHASSRRLGSTG